MPFTEQQWEQAPEWERLWRRIARRILDAQAARKDGVLSEQHLMELLTEYQPEVESLTKSIQARGPRDERAEPAAALMRAELERQVNAGISPAKAYASLPRRMKKHFDALAADGKLTDEQRGLWALDPKQWERWRNALIPRP